MGLFKPVKQKIQPKGRWQVTLTRDMCKDCKFCIEVCPTDVFAQEDRPNALGWFPMQVAHADLCIGCMLCYQLCPDFVIDVQKLA